MGRPHRLLAGDHRRGPEPGIDGGIGRRQDADDQITNTIDVPDLDAAVAAVEAAGGTITRAQGPVPGVGWLAYASTPRATRSG